MKEIKWLWTMKKPQVPLAQGLHVIAVPLMQKNLGIKTDLPIKHVDGDIYFGDKAIKEIFDQIKEKSQKDSRYPYMIRDKIKKSITNLKKVILSLEKHDLTGETDDEFLDLFMKGYNAVGELTAFMSFKGTVQMSDVLEERLRTILYKKISGREEQENIFLLLSTSEQDSLMGKEQKNILKIACKIQQGKKIKEDLKKHLIRFRWMGCVMYLGKPYTQQHFEDEIQQVLNEDCIIKLKNIKKKKIIREKCIKQYIKQLKFTQQEKKLLEQFRVWVHLRTYIKDMTSVGITATLPFLEEIAKRADVGYKDLLYLSYEELQEIFTNKKHDLIGTRIATKAFKTGDIVVVDAEKGVVRKT
ncbi:MAG: hypothetical protein ABIG89_00610 [Candidatus Woesearchaeota archaeon]